MESHAHILIADKEGFDCCECGYSIAPATAKDVIDDLRRILADTIAEVDRLKAEVSRWKRAVEGLTPSGSEFVDDPERCAARIRQVYSPVETFKTLRAHRDELASLLQRMVDECSYTRVAPEGILASAPCLLTLEPARAALARLGKEGE